MKPIVFILALLGTVGSSAQEPVSLGTESRSLSGAYASGAYNGPAAGINSTQYGTYAEFSDVREGISREMDASLTGLLDDRLATDLEQQSDSQVQRSAES